ncbi:MAG: peptide-methionine (R)-S-oxide reductase MsrB [Mariprofundales bacterium]
MNSDRRGILIKLSLATALLFPLALGVGRMGRAASKGEVMQRIEHSDAEWQQMLTPEQYDVLRQEGTERPLSSALNGEHRGGEFHCAGCDLPLFDAQTKYDSGTGWPSFYDAIPGRVETKVDFKMILPRTEYHCIRCGGHQGHRFDDGPKPTGYRYCNNGVALRFVPRE